MTKKIVEKHSSPYDLSSKGGFKRQPASNTNSQSRTPYDLNRAGKRNTGSNGLRPCEKNS